jgi:hypothetical protein
MRALSAKVRLRCSELGSATRYQLAQLGVMTAEHGSTPGAEPSGTGDETGPIQSTHGSLPSKKTTWQQLVQLGAILAGIIAVVSGILSIAGIFSGDHDLKHRLLEIAGTMAVLAVAACIVSLLRNKQMSIVICILAGSLIVLSSSAVLLFHSNAITNTAALKATIRFSNPYLDAQDPLGVQCSQPIEVSGVVPKGYIFAVGNVIVGTAIGKAVPVFVPESKQYEVSPGVWKVPQVFGNSTNGGEEFVVYLVIMPLMEQQYLTKEAQQVRAALAMELQGGLGSKLPSTITAFAVMRKDITVAAGQTWWIAPGLPPPPSRKLEVEYARQTLAC